MRPQLILVVFGFVFGISQGSNAGVEPPVRFGSFNIRAFGKTKLNKPEVVSMIAQITRRYDIMFVVEIRDQSEEAMQEFLEILNKDLKAPVYKMVLSGLLGRGSYKEKYGYFYNSQTVHLIRATEYTDEADKWERNPYLAQFHLPTAKVANITVIGMHVKPDDVVKELNSVPHVVDFAEKKWNSKNIFLAGDLNCDCSYVSPEEFAALTIRKDLRYQWLIDRCADRTAITTNCVYDRIIAVGERLQKAVVKGSAVSYPFDQVFGLTKDQALEVSDHRPVECEIAGKISGLQRPVVSQWSFSVEQLIEKVQENAVRAIYRAKDVPSHDRASFSVTLLKKDSRIYQVLADRLVTAVVPALREFDQHFPNVVLHDTIQAVAAFEHKLPNTCGAAADCQKRRVRIDCIMETPWRCNVAVAATLTSL